MRFLLTLSALLFGVLASLIVVHRFVGTRLPPPRSFVLTVMGDMQPINGVMCWRMICPAQTEVAQVRDLIERWTDLKAVFGGLDRPTNLHLEAHTLPRWTTLIMLHRDTGRVARIELHTEMNALNIGDLVSRLGTPLTRRSEFSYGLWTTVLCFEGQVCAGIIDNEALVTVYAKVDFLQFAEISTRPNRRLQQITHGWRGFTWVNGRTRE